MMDKIFNLCNKLLVLFGSIPAGLAMVIFIGVPFIAFLVTLSVCAFSEKIRCKSKFYFWVIGIMSGILLFCYALCEISVNGTNASFNFYTALVFVIVMQLVVFGLYLALKQIKGSKTYLNYNGGLALKTFNSSYRYPQESEDKTSANALELCPATMQCNEESEQYFNVKLQHTFSIIERLKSLRMLTTDRLEVEKLERDISSLSGKQLYTEDEATRLNDCLAILLKLTAKYDL